MGVLLWRAVAVVARVRGLRPLLLTGRGRAAGGFFLKVASIVGARPQFIKAAPVHEALEQAGAKEILIHTGQHYDYEMSEIFFEGLDLPAPDYHLDVGSAPHGVQTGEMMKCLEPVLVAERPDVVVVHGDTNSTLAGALVAVKLQLPVAHIEAGLRSRRMDVPEEVNRVVADHVSSWLFCPTQTAVDNLAAEGITEGVALCGDVMRDVLDHSLPKIGDHTQLLRELGVEPGGYAVATIHRSENTDDRDRLDRIFAGLVKVSEHMPLLVPLHPRTRAALGDADLKGIRTLPPLGYADMLCLCKHARVIVTDSGGLQKEAYWLGVRCVTPRRETEWVETLQGDWNVLTDDDPDSIARAAIRPEPSTPRSDEFGGRNASARIVEYLASALHRNTSGVR